MSVFVEPSIRRELWPPSGDSNHSMMIMVPVILKLRRETQHSTALAKLWLPVSCSSN